MDSEGQHPRAQSIVARHAYVQNVAGGYYNHSHNCTTNVKNIQVSKSSQHEMEALLKHVAHGALHDSAERGPDAPKCHPETRTAVQKDIMSWIEHGEQDDTPKRVLWLSGPAGSGKTAIAGTIADECYKKGLLAASFFFSAFAGSLNRRLSKNVVSTLLYSLLQHRSIVGLKEEVLAAIEGDPIVFKRHLDQQLDKLILEPLRKVVGRSDHRYWPTVIIVDGLDECQGGSELDVGDPVSSTRAQKEVLSVLSRACSDPVFPFRIVIASRPEPTCTIRDFLSNPPTLVLSLFLDDKYDPDSDIRLFLEAMFSNIRRQLNLPSTWASKGVVDLLVKQVSGQFIYAATVIRFLDNPRLGPPQKQLSRLLEWRCFDDSKPFAPLDMLYSRILHTSPDPLLAVTWLGLIDRHLPPDLEVTGGQGLSPYIKTLLESYPGQTEYLLGSLTSLVRLTDENGRPHFYFYHKSLLDFLQDPFRSSELHVNNSGVHHFTMDRYYQILQNRGPLSNVGPSTNPPSRDFLEKFCSRLNYYLDSRPRYTLGDVEWYLANHCKPNSASEIPRMFARIHWQCKWYHCVPACGIWRKGILQYCREHGWRLPTTKEVLRDRFKKYDFNLGWRHEFPLRAPVVESESPLASIYAGSYQSSGGIRGTEHRRT